MKHLLQEISALCLDSLSEDWVDAVYSSEFLEFADLPPEYEIAIENLILKSTFKNVAKAIDKWLQSESNNEDKSWAILSHRISVKRLLALLAYNIQHGCKNTFIKEYRDKAISASRLYYKLLAVPGSKAYHIYHSQLFSHSITCLSFPTTLCESDNYFNERDLVTDVNLVLKRLAHFVFDLKTIIKNLKIVHTGINFEDILSNIVDITSGGALSKYNIDMIELQKIRLVIYEITHTLLCNSNGEPNSTAIQILYKCLLPKLLTTSCGNVSVRVSYVTYSNLLLTTYGKVALSGFTVLLEHLCYTMDGLERAEMRTARVSLVIGLMSLLPQKSYRKMVKWILKLSISAKAAHRHIALDLIANFLNDGAEETEDCNTTIEQDEPSYNMIVSDDENSIDSRRFQEIREEEISQVQQRVRKVPLAALLHAVYARVNDTSATLRVRALTILTACVASERPAMKQVIEELNGIGDVTRLMVVAARGVGDERALVRKAAIALVQKLPATTSRTPTVPTSINIVSNDKPPENEVSILNNKNKDATPTADPKKCAEDTIGADSPMENAEVSNTMAIDYDNMANVKRRAECNNVNDNSHCDTETISATKTSSNETADDNMQTCNNVAGIESPGTSTESVSDSSSQLIDRTSETINKLSNLSVDAIASNKSPSVRDSSSSRHSSAASNTALDSGVDSPAPNGSCNEIAEVETTNDVAILIGLCRDASIIVRSTAIAAISDMVITQPSDAAFDAFLAGPMPQLSDPENKVQEQVLSIMKRILFEPLQKYDVSAVEKSLPWMLLAAITRHKMKRHLMKACTMLGGTSSCINQRLVDILSTHLGASNELHDLHTLLLLGCIARQLDYSDLTFILDYYYKLADLQAGAGENRDVRLMTLTLDVLTTWRRFLKDEERNALRHHLITRLAFADDGSRIPAVTLAANLDINDLSWATDMMQKAERRAIAGGGVEECVCAADLSLVAPCPPSPALMQYLQGALSHPPPDWGVCAMGSCAAAAGRLCLRSRAAAVALTPALAALLPDLHAPLAARINALYALCDVCARYTSIVEPVLPTVCECLTPPSENAMRRVAARCVTRLLLAGYLRLRPPLYYRYCALLADDDHEVSEPAEYYLTCCLPIDKIYHHFVDCVLYYNSEDTEYISFDSRQLIYDVMLQRLSLVQKLNVQCRLAKEVLQHAADVSEENVGAAGVAVGGTLPAALHDAVLDTITVLCGPRMKLPKKQTNENTGEGADLEDLQERVTKNIVSHKMKVTVAEVLVPAVLRLYARLSAGGGQLVAYLVRLANDLLNDYNKEIEELIENDEEIVGRIHHFQETIGVQPTRFGNARNLVTASAAPDPDTPLVPRRRPAPRSSHSHTPRKRIHHSK